MDYFYNVHFLCNFKKDKHIIFSLSIFIFNARMTDYQLEHSLKTPHVFVLLTFLLPALSNAETNSGDTASILTSSSLVLFMTLPGLALFYAGLV